MQRNPKRLTLASLALLLCASLQSCFTTALWTSDIDPRGKAALTPVSLTLDAVTAPAQLAVFSGHGRHHHYPRRRARRGGRRCR